MSRVSYSCGSAWSASDGNPFAFSVTQMDLADAVDLSTVHLNCSLQELRASGLKDRILTIHDFIALCTTAMFNPNYLHLDQK